MYDNDYGFTIAGTDNTTDDNESVKTEEKVTAEAVTDNTTPMQEAASAAVPTQDVTSATAPTQEAANPRYTDLTGSRPATTPNGYYSSGGTGFSGYTGGTYNRSYGNSGNTYNGTGGTPYSGARSNTYSQSAGNTYSGTTGSAYGSSQSNTYSRTAGSGSYTGQTGAGYTGGTSYTSSQSGSSYGSTYNDPNNNNTGYNRYGYTADTTKKKKKEKGEKKGRFGLVLGAAAILMAGILGGSAISYAFLNSRIAAVEKSVTDASAKNSSAVTTVPDRIELNKSDDHQGIKDAVAESAAGTSAGTMTVADVVQNNLSSVVAITNYGVTEIRSFWGNFKQDTQSAGSGVVIAKTDDELLILTNYHVVEDYKTLSVVFSWDEDMSENADDVDIINAVVKDYDSSRDIAVISIPIDELSDETLDMVTLAKVGSSDDLMLGEQVVAIGNALGYGQSVTTGIVSALDRQIGATDSYGNTDSNTYIQTDAAINPGNSGGALFNMNGELVGINSAKIGGSQVDSVGYAIPISDIMDEVESMMNQETRETVELSQRGYLGVSIVDVTEEISMTYGLPTGIYISAVNPGSGAEKAGLQKEDVITAINGKTVSSAADLKEYLSTYSIGETVTLTVAQASNNYETKDMDVTLGADPNVTTN